ncbi:MAG: Hsp70 family protein [Chloroflexota bacterium]
MIIGMDFGTTNSGMAVYDGRQVHLLPLDPANANPSVIRTALYVGNDASVTVGRAAVNRYFVQNTGRSARLQKVRVGEIEVRGADMFYVRDVYVWVDVLSPGRLFLSFKTSLRDADYQGTVVGQSYYSLENLVAMYLTVTRVRAERLLGREIREVVLGRPVHFSQDPQQDALAQARLLEAAFRAGYEKVYFQYEPTAAAYHYATTSGRAENILIFDFGGGTLDLTIMRVDGGRRQVLATGGVPIAGDIFDQKLVRAKLPTHFGEGTVYGPRGQELPAPRWIFDVFANWQTIMELQTPESRQMLNQIAQTARHRQGIKNLISLVSGNYSLYMFDAVEQAKRELSERLGAMIRFNLPQARILQLVTRTDFENIIHQETQVIERHLDETVRASGLAAHQIDSIIRTGGSSQIPVFVDILERKFGRDRVRSLDIFSSVTSGLAIIAQAIERGNLEARGYTPSDSQTRLASAAGRPGIPPVNLELLQRRVVAQESAAGGEAAQPTLALVWLAGGNRLAAVSLPAGQERPFDGNTPWPTPLKAALVAPLDELLLLVTSRYRFLLVTPRQLMDLGELGLTVRDFHHFVADEELCTLNHWPALRSRPRLLLVTSRGFVRAYTTETMIPAIEGPIPLAFDQPLPGVPAALVGSQADDELVLVTDGGRAVRQSVVGLPAAGMQLYNRQPDERIIGAAAGPGEEQLVVVTADGYGKRLSLAWVPPAAKGITRGKAIITRQPVRAIATVGPEQSLWVVTTQRWVTAGVGRLPLDEETSTRSHKWIRLYTGEEVVGFFSSF